MRYPKRCSWPWLLLLLLLLLPLLHLYLLFLHLRRRLRLRLLTLDTARCPRFLSRKSLSRRAHPLLSLYPQLRARRRAQLRFRVPRTLPARRRRTLRRSRNARRHG